MLEMILMIVGGLAALYFLINLIAARLSLSPIRVPQYISPGLMGLPQETVELEVDGLTLKGWHVPADSPQGVLVCLHGYIMNRCEWTPMAGLFRDQGWSSLHVDFRGQGRSTGKRCSFGWHEKRDVAVIVAWAKQRHPGVPVVILGSSMGAASAVLAMAEDPKLADGLILDGVFRSLEHASRGWWLMVGGPWLNRLLRPTVWIGSAMQGFHPSTISVEKALPHLQGVPMLFLYGTSDPLVSREDVAANLAAAGDSAQVEWFEDAGHGHGRFREPYRYQRILNEFLTKFGCSA